MYVSVSTYADFDENQGRQHNSSVKNYRGNS